jgi:hypothetical protein
LHSHTHWDSRCNFVLSLFQARQLPRTTVVKCHHRSLNQGGVLGLRCRSSVVDSIQIQFQFLFSSEEVSRLWRALDSRPGACGRGGALYSEKCGSCLAYRWLLRYIFWICLRLASRINLWHDRSSRKVQCRAGVRYTSRFGIETSSCRSMISSPQRALTEMYVGLVRRKCTTPFQNRAHPGYRPFWNPGSGSAGPPEPPPDDPQTSLLNAARLLDIDQLYATFGVNGRFSQVTLSLELACVLLVCRRVVVVDGIWICSTSRFFLVCCNWSVGQGPGLLCSFESVSCLALHICHTRFTSAFATGFTSQHSLGMPGLDNHMPSVPTSPCM